MILNKIENKNRIIKSKSSNCSNSNIKAYGKCFSLRISQLHSAQSEPSIKAKYSPVFPTTLNCKGSR